MKKFGRFGKLTVFLLVMALSLIVLNAGAADVMVGTWKTMQTIQPFFYNNFLQKEQQVQVRTFTNPGDQKNALLAGSLGLTGTTITQAIISASKGEPVVVVSSLCMKCSALVVGENSGITKTSELRGKKIGYVPGTMHQVLLFDALAKAGMTRNDVQLIRVDFFDMVTALSRGQIDAFLSGEPYPTIAELNGTGKILAYPYFGDTIGTINAGMLTTREMIKKDPQKIQNLVNAHAMTTERLKANPEVWFAKAKSFGLEERVIRQAAQNIELSWDMDDSFLRHTHNLALRMKELGIIERVPDLNSYIDTRFVKSAVETIRCHDKKN